MKHIFALSFLFMFLSASAQDKQQVASTEPMHVKESNVLWKAAISDTLKLCVINASSVAVMNASFPMEKNVTRQVSFRVTNDAGEGRMVNAVVTGIATWNGKKCYTAQLEIGNNFQTHMVYRKVDCILADLTENPHKLLVGKNWLGDDIEVAK